MAVFDPDLKETLIDIEGQTINFLRFGTGKRTVIFLPGYLGTIWSDFSEQIKKIDRKHLDVIFMDLPGFGKSRPPERIPSNESFIKDVEAIHNLMKHLSIKKTTLAGWSNGGHAAMIFAALYPESIEKLIIWGANAFYNTSALKICKKLKNFDLWTTKNKDTILATYGKSVAQKIWSDRIDYLEYNTEDLCTADKLAKITCPTLIIHGELDFLISRKHLYQMLDKIKHSKLNIIPKGAHDVHLEMPDVFNEAVTSFVLQ